MANKNALNKNSVYVQSLVDFLLDTKPYHSKLTEIAEEYRFFDDVNVKVVERFTSKTKINSSWLYNYFSSANPLFRTMPAKRAVSPSFFSQEFKVGADENKDLALVPYVYSKKAFEGVGVNGAFINESGVSRRLTESIDYFQSHGSFQFQIKQNRNANGVLDPTWSTTPDDGLLREASAVTTEIALDETNPASAISRVRALLDEIQEAVIAAGGHPQVQTELNGFTFYDEQLKPTPESLFGILNSKQLPRSYENLLAWLSIPNDNDVVVEFKTVDGVEHDRQWFEREFSKNTSPLFFGMFTDMGSRESGKLEFKTTLRYLTVGSDKYVEQLFVKSDALRVFDIVSGNAADEWFITVDDIDTERYRVVGSNLGFAGFVTAGQAFNTNKISFKTERLAKPKAGDEVVLTPTRKVVVGPEAELETWNIIKTNPIAYTRPQFVSTRTGFIQDNNGKHGSITIMDSTFPTDDILITARGDGFFDVVSLNYPERVGVAEVGKPFGDQGGYFKDKLGFTLLNGEIPFAKGDRFYISIQNDPPRIENVDLGFGYDLDPYDDNGMLYPSDTEFANVPLGFGYDGRFTDYDLSLLNIHATENAKHGRKWRIKPRKVGGERLLGIVGAKGELQIYEALQFSVEYSDNDFMSFITPGFITVNGTFSDVGLGVSFTLKPASKPFVLVSALDDDTPGVINPPRVVGGDTVSFEVFNPAPKLLETYLSLSSPRLPQLSMHADSFYETRAAFWAVDFTSPTAYNITARNTDNQVIYQRAVDTSKEGWSFKNDDVHFTVNRGLGIKEGDSFTFETFNQKPSYLVHGSVTGWTAPATVGKYYWNGKIGFKINAPKGELFVQREKTYTTQYDGSYSDDDTTNEPTTYTIKVWDSINSVEYSKHEDDDPDLKAIDFKLREDCPALSYLFTRNSRGYIVTRSDNGVPVFAQFNSIFKDIYLTLDLAGVVKNEFKLVVDAHDYQLWNSADVVIVNPNIRARLPLPGSSVIIEKTEESRISLNMVGRSTAIAPLGPITIDQRFIDLNTKGIPLSNTSPETALLQGWIPLTVDKFNAVGAPAIFNDPVTKHVVKSAISNEAIGVLKQQDPNNANEPIVFEWDEAFYKKYLPLNAEANLVITDTGWNDLLRVRISESVKFLLGGGALTEDWLFHDDVNVKIQSDHVFKIVDHLNDAFSTKIEDSPFDGFLPGYDNLPYDQEDGQDGAYDAGQPPDIMSLLSKFDITSLEISDVLDRWNHFLHAPIIPTNKEQWDYLYENLGLDPTISIERTTDFGLPVRGLGIAATEAPVTETKTKFEEALVSTASDDGSTFDNPGFDTRALDQDPESVAIIHGGSLPIVPTDFPPGTTFYTLDTAINLPISALRHSQRTDAAVWVIPQRIQGVVKEVSVIDSRGATLSTIGVEQDGKSIILTFAEPCMGKATIILQTIARIFELSFSAEDNTAKALTDLESFTPTISIWMPNKAAPIQIPVIEQVEGKEFPGQLRKVDLSGSEQNKARASRTFRFSLARPTEGKIIVG